MKNTRIIVLSIIFSLFTMAFADVFPMPEYGYVIDFPEGFSLDDGSEDLSLLLFRHTMLPVEVLVKVWGIDAYSSAEAALKDTFAKLGGQGETAALRWRNQQCVISQMTMQNAALTGQYGGWAMCVPVPQKGWLTVMAYAPAEVATDVEPLLLSVLDSVMTDTGSYKEAGLVTAYAFPAGATKEIALDIAGKKITAQLGVDDGEAAQFVIDREWAVFIAFAETEYAFEAWQRFYRLIARDTMGRTKRLAFAVQNALQADAQKTDPDQPEAAIAQMLLQWTQYFPYARASVTEDKADFAPIPSILEGAASDCDSRSMLIAALLKNMGVDACIFISAEYSHAVLGVALDGKQGQTILVDDTDYLVGETTAKDATLGMLDATMQDRTKWLPVVFYE